MQFDVPNFQYVSVFVSYELFEDISYFENVLEKKENWGQLY